MKRMLFGLALIVLLAGCETTGSTHPHDDPHPPVGFSYGACFDWAYSELIVHWGYPHPHDVHFYEDVAGTWCNCVSDHGNWYYDYHVGFYVFDTDDSCYYEVVHPWE
jgi:hypothetical protein